MKFEKYSSTGNDFILIDQSQQIVTSSNELWKKLCHRHHGIGADGVILTQPSEREGLDFVMTYFNADGNEVAMCGNGARAAVHFACQKYHLSALEKITFKTLEGTYLGEILENSEVKLRMTEIYDESKIKISDLFFSKSSFYINTGVPHCVYQVDSVDEVDIVKNGAKVRYDKRFEKGVNFNVFERQARNKLKMRTYERGVEGETLSCGTGAVATAISAHKNFGDTGVIEIETPGGILKVSLDNDLNEVYLIGKAIKVFSGEVDLSQFS